MRKVKGYFLFFLIFCGVTCSLAQTDKHLSRTQEVPAIEVQNGNQAELASLLIAALQVESTTEYRKMAYFELKSSLENKQIELIEAYFQLSQGAFGPKTAALKTGRFALLRFENRYFTSHAIQLHLQQVLQAFLEEVDRGSRKKAMLKMEPNHH
jgi:hypothetical protein